jgi:hypothetical protein
VTSDVGAELAVMLPSGGSGKFASLFKELDGAIKSAGFASYGISCTTLEEVFLSIARGGVGGGAASRRMSLDGKNAKMVDDGAVDGDSADGTPLMADDHDAIAEADEDLRRGYVKGRALLARQARGLLWKRYLNWRRDAWSVLIQIVVPVLFFVLALVLAGLDYSEDTDFVPIDVSRANLLGNTPTVTSADSSDAGVADVLSRWPEMDIQIQPTHAPSLGCECNCPQVNQPPVFFPAECCAYDFSAANVSMHASIEAGGFDSNGDSDSDEDGADENYASKILAVYSWCQATRRARSVYQRRAWGWTSRRRAWPTRTTRSTRTCGRAARAEARCARTRRRFSATRCASSRTTSRRGSINTSCTRTRRRTTRSGRRRSRRTRRFCARA